MSQPAQRRANGEHRVHAASRMGVGVVFMVDGRAILANGDRAR